MSYVKLDAILSLLYFAVLTCYGENKMDVDWSNFLRMSLERTSAKYLRIQLRVHSAAIYL